VCRSGVRARDTFDRICRLACQHLGARAASVLILDRSDKRLQLAGQRDKRRSRLCDGDYEIGEGKTGWIAKHGKPIRLVARDGSDEERQSEVEGYVG